MQNKIEVFTFLDKYSYSDKEILINKLMEMFKYTRNEAISVYYKWKQNFMKSIKCIPKAEKLIAEKSMQQPRIIGKVVSGRYGIYKILDHGSIMVSPKGTVLVLFFCDIYEVRRYIQYRHNNGLKDIDNSLYESIRVLELLDKWR